MDRKAVAFLLIAVTVLSTSLMTSKVVCAASTTNKENLITNVTNSSNAKISFYLNVPAGQTVSYKLELIPNTRTGSIDTKSGSIKNSKKTQISKKITVSTKYYSNKYTVFASYSTGSARNRKIYQDVDKATSALKTTVYTNKFVWNDTNVKRWKTGQRVGVVLCFAVTGTVDILATKGYISGTLATGLSITSFVGDLNSAGTVTDIRNIASTPIKGWGYQVKLVPYNGGYTKYFLVYDAFGRVYQNINLGKVSISTISLAAR